MTNQYSVQKVLELACSAQRVNNGYIKEVVSFTDENDQVHKKIPNRGLITFALGSPTWDYFPKEHRPPLIEISQEDKELADKIRFYFRKLIFSAITDENSFESNVNTFLNSENIAENNIGYIACLPSVYLRSLSKDIIKKASKTCDHVYLGAVGDKLSDVDSEIIECTKSKNFEAYNITAIIDNKMVSWMSSNKLDVGPAVLIKANIKELSSQYFTGIPVTRLNYVKAVQ